MPDVDIAVVGRDGRFSVFQFHCAEAPCRGEEGGEVAVCCRVDIKRFVDGVVTDSRQCLEQTVTRHGPCIPMSAFILVERIADSPVVPVPDRAYDFQPLLRFAQKDQVCGTWYSIPVHTSLL